jgi:hypothetical protein
MEVSMLIDVLVEGKHWIRYESTIVPRIGETISTLKPDKQSFKVMQVDHLVRHLSLTDERRQELVTVTAG